METQSWAPYYESSIVCLPENTTKTPLWPEFTHPVIVTSNITLCAIPQNSSSLNGYMYMTGSLLQGTSEASLGTRSESIRETFRLSRTRYLQAESAAENSAAVDMDLVESMPRRRKTSESKKSL